MALRFQKENDEVDQAATGERGGIITIAVIIAVVGGVGAWLGGRSLHSYLEDMGILAGFAWVLWFVVPIYSEFRIRTKEIHGMVSEIRESISALQGRMNAIEDELHSLR